LEFDVIKSFDKINRHRLRLILRENIQDESLFCLLDKMFKIKIIDKDKIFIASNLKISQANLLSPLLCNIYFDKLD
jgi:retron-type reverse transcriptase